MSPIITIVAPTHYALIALEASEPRAPKYSFRFATMGKIEFANLPLLDRHGAPTDLTRHFDDRLLVILLRHLA